MINFAATLAEAAAATAHETAEYYIVSVCIYIDIGTAWSWIEMRQKIEAHNARAANGVVMRCSARVKRCRYIYAYNAGAQIILRRLEF